MEEIKFDILKGVWAQVYNLFKLPREVYTRTANKLITQINKGFGASFESLPRGTTKWNQIRLFYHNSHVFSGAKTFQQVKDMSAFIFDADGNKTSFADFEKKAGGIFDTYNKRWLQTELDTAYHVSFGAKQWHGFWDDRDLFPILEYNTVGDQRVRDEHIVLDGIKKRIEDPFWNTYFPPNGFNCRCDVTSTDEGQLNVDKEFGFKPDKLFDMNPGRSAYVFNEKVHPYFNVEQKYEVLKAMNFNLPIPRYE